MEIKAMQERMKTHQLTQTQITSLLASEPIGRLATLNQDGCPYITPVHFVLHNDKIYIHGLIKGQKIDNIKSNPNVCFEIDKMEKYLMSDEPCDVNTEYASVIILGKAQLLTDEKAVIAALDKIVAKYTPALAGKPFPPNMLKATSIIEISMTECTGKFYK